MPSDADTDCSAVKPERSELVQLAQVLDNQNSWQLKDLCLRVCSPHSSTWNEMLLAGHSEF